MTFDLAVLGVALIALVASAVTARLWLGALDQKRCTCGGIILPDRERIDLPRALAIHDESRRRARLRRELRAGVLRRM